MKQKRPSPRTPARVPATPRLDLVDAARGVAIVAMVAYHFCFDLTWYHWATWPMLDDARWIAARSAIVTSFLFVTGVSLALRDARERRAGTTGWLEAAFLRRWAQIAGAAVLVTVGSAFLFPATFIYFGVLHFVAVAWLICRRAPRLGPWALVLGAIALLAGLAVASPTFDPRVVDWIGFAAHKPHTEDYVPLFPWLGVVLIGCGAGAWWGRHGFRTTPFATKAWTTVPAPLRTTLAGMGRWSLTIYLLHQPILLGVLGAVKALG